MVGAGDAFAPAEASFRVMMRGQARTWLLDVVVRPQMFPARSSDDYPTRIHELELSALQRRTIEAYLEPMRRGRLEPATHREVAESLGCHPNTAREVLYGVWAEMFAAAVPMPDVADKRVAVVEAIRLHRLLG